MNTDQILGLYDKEQRQEIELFDHRREVTPNIIRHVARSGVGREGVIIYSRMSTANVEDTIREQIAYFDGLGQDFEWKVYDYDTPADLKDLLVAHGFKAEDPEAVLALDLQEAPPVLLQPITADVRRVTDLDDINDVIAVQKQVWQEDLTWLGRQLEERLQRDPENLSVYLAYVDGLPVSSAWIEFFRQSQFAYLWGGSTLPDYRKRGLYTALLATRTQEALGRGVRFLSVDTSPMSRPILEKFGFQLLTYAHPRKWRVKPPPEEKG